VKLEKKTKSNYFIGAQQTKSKAFIEQKVKQHKVLLKEEL
jgi:hypothetical protein